MKYALPFLALICASLSCNDSKEKPSSRAAVIINEQDSTLVKKKKIHSPAKVRDSKTTFIAENIAKEYMQQYFVSRRYFLVDTGADPIQVVLSHGKKWYTVYYCEGHPEIKIANRPAKTTSLDVHECCYDIDLDGEVDFGIIGDETKALADIDTAKTKYFSAELGVGLSYKGYWQSKYRESVDSVYAFLAKHQRQ